MKFDFEGIILMYERRKCMSHLKCYENSCRSNHCSHCVKDIIKVGLDAYCHSYLRKEEEARDEAKFEYEFASDMGYASAMDNHPIQCENNRCQYQEAGMCHLSHVQIDSKAQGPLCVSYLPYSTLDK